MIPESELLRQFRLLCFEARIAENFTDDPTEAYDALLNLLQTHADRRELLTAKLVALVYEFRHSRARGGSDVSADAIGHCMRVLRWPEVLEAAEHEQADFFDWRRSSTLAPIFDAYRDPEVGSA